MPRGTRSSSPLLIGAAALAAVSLLLVAFASGWFLAAHSGVGASERPAPEVVEVPVLNPVEGTHTATMPDLRGLDEESALQVISDSGLDVNAVTTEQRPSAGAVGVVLEQTPVFGMESPGGIHLTVSDEAAVPDLVGIDASEARNELDLLGAAAEITERYEPDAAEGIVLETDPEPGSELPETVTMVVSAAPATHPLAEVDQEEHGCTVRGSHVLSGVEHEHTVACSVRHHSPTEASWLLRGAADTLTATLGIPDSESMDAEATVTVLADGSEIYSENITWGQPVDLELDTAGALRLDLILEVPEEADSTVVAFGDAQLVGDAQMFLQFQE
ncbi:PASTA domain-containing protein [Nesterenkonia ebinurensis]|uniref:PASTA domain-containing protein n=1 Tax=Nesterenkonia ebinurensis TaxID=2608252 RepID=UPI00168A63B0|nr:PASTA domain-containing protein [Nesterenkonia ebinurensis]